MSEGYKRSGGRSGGAGGGGGGFAETLPGVVADNATDNAAVIQAALNSPAREIVLPPGKIVIASTLTIPNGTVLRGLFDSPGTFEAAIPPDDDVTTTLRRTGNGDTIQIPTTSARAKLKGLHLDGGNNVRTVGSHVNILASGSPAECQFVMENCFLAEAPLSAVIVGANRRAVRVVNCELYNDAQSTDNALVVAGSDFVALGCLITNFGNTSHDAVYLNGSTTKLIGCDIWGSRYGIFMQSGNGHMIAECGIDTNQKSAIYVADPVDGVTLASCDFHSNSQEGDGFNADIKVDTTRLVTISSPVFTALDSGITNRVGYCIEKGGSARAPMVSGLVRQSGHGTQANPTNFLANSRYRKPWTPAAKRFANIDRASANGLGNIAAPNDGQLRLNGGIVLPGGETFTTIGFITGTTPAVALLNQWFALIDTAGNVLVKTNDATSAAWGANTEKELTMSAAYTPLDDIEVYVAILLKATTTRPSLRGIGSFAGVTPFIAGDATSGLTNPASLGATISLPGAENSNAYCWVR